MERLFGTDGVRGVANLELTPQLAYNLGQALAYMLTNKVKDVPEIIVGRDTRISGPMLESALVAGICSVGAKAILVGVVPTPAVACLIRLYKAHAGAMISASHNPFQDNGIKFLDSNGYKLSDDIEDEIEKFILLRKQEISLPIGEKVGVRVIKEDSINDYKQFLKNTVDMTFKDIKIAVDCANGSAYQCGPQILRELGAEIFVINDAPDGININQNCGSTKLDSLKELVKRVNANIGLAFDGDADRVLAVDETGETIDGDKIMAIVGLNMKNKGLLAKNTIVTTVMSNLGFDIMAKRENLNVVKTKVGDRYVLEEMKQNGYMLGGEQSGHIIFLEHNSTGDGILTALQLIKVLKESNKKASELSKVVEILPQVLKNAKVKNTNKHKYLEDETIAKMCKDLENEFNGEGRVLIRPSGTEPVVRVMIEGKDLYYIKEKATELANTIEEKLG